MCLDKTVFIMSDEQLYDRYLNGEIEVLDELLIRHKENLIHFLMGYVHDLDDAEDLMMDTFALLLAKKMHFRGESSFRTWLFGIGRNLARAYVRRKTRFSFVRYTDHQDEMENTVFETDFLQEEEEKGLYLAMQELKEEYRTVLYLQYFEKMDAAQTAAVMKKTVKQIYNLTARAKEQLKCKLPL